MIVKRLYFEKIKCINSSKTLPYKYYHTLCHLCPSIIAHYTSPCVLIYSIKRQTYTDYDND